MKIVKLQLLLLGGFTLLVLMGCDQKKLEQLESENTNLKKQTDKLSAQLQTLQVVTNSLSTERTNLQARLDDVSKKFSDLEKQYAIVEQRATRLQDKLEAEEKLNAIIQKQVESAQSEAQKEQNDKKQLAAKEVIRALRKLNSALGPGISQDDYHRRLQELKITLDDKLEEIQDAGFKDLVYNKAYRAYGAALTGWYLESQILQLGKGSLLTGILIYDAQLRAGGAEDIKVIMNTVRDFMIEFDLLSKNSGNNPGDFLDVRNPECMTNTIRSFWQKASSYTESANALIK